MHKKYTNILTVITLAIFIAGVFASCSNNNIEKVEQLTSFEKLADESLQNVELLYSDSAKLSLRLIASKLDRYSGEKPYTEFTEGVKLVFYDSNAEPETQIQCNYAIDYTDENRMEAKDDVIVINRDGERLNTEHLIWDKKDQKIHTDRFVRIATTDEIIYGNGLEANEDFTQYKINNIKGTIQIEEDEDVQ